MPVERQNWAPVGTLPQVNAQLLRTVHVLDASVRYTVQAVTSTKTVELTFPCTLIEGDTGGGAVTITFPSATTVPGFRVDAVKTAGAAALTVNGVVVATFAGWVSSGANWRRVA